MKMEMTVPNFIRHVQQIADAFGITVVYVPEFEREEARAMLLHEDSWISRMGKSFGLTDSVVLARPIDDVTGYVVVMHEMGHHLAPNGLSRMPKPKPGSHPREGYAYWAAKLVAEEAAWEWARYYIEQQFEWTVAMEMVKKMAFATYENARRKGR